MLLLETLDIAEPADRIADRADRKLDHHFTILRVVIVDENRLLFAFAENLQPETDEEFLDAGNQSAGHRIGIVQYDAGIQVLEADPVFPVIVRKRDPDAVIEIETDALHRFQCRNFRNFAIGGRRRRVHRHPGRFRRRFGTSA